MATRNASLAASSRSLPLLLLLAAVEKPLIVVSDSTMTITLKSPGSVGALLVVGAGDISEGAPEGGRETVDGSSVGVRVGGLAGRQEGRADGRRVGALTGFLDTLEGRSEGLTTGRSVGAVGLIVLGAALDGSIVGLAVVGDWVVGCAEVGLYELGGAVPVGIRLSAGC